MKAKKMDSCCDMPCGHPKGKALLEIAIGLVLIAYAMGLYDMVMSAGIIGALVVMKGAVRFWEAKCHH